MTPEPAPALQLRVGSATDVGRIRPTNEDALLRSDARRLFGVADGMGGHQAGEVASVTALEVLRQRAEGTTPLEEAVQAANAAVYEKAQADPTMRGMGTTVTVLRIDGRTARIAHVGDSRAYLLREGTLTQVTDDHSLVEELVREGRLTPDEAAVHPQRSIITRALGVDERVEVDTYEVDLRARDRLLLCSDGLTSMLRDRAIEELLRNHPDPQDAADHLVAAANEAGGEDNVTVVVIDVVAEGGREEALEASTQLPPSPSQATGEWERTDAVVAIPPTETPPPRPVRTVLRRLALGSLPVVATLTAAALVLAWYGRRTYYVGFDGDRVAVFQGVPNGFLLWDPTVEVRHDWLRTNHLSDFDRADLREGHRFTSREAAERYMARLAKEAAPSTSTTTTTVPAPEGTGPSAVP